MDADAVASQSGHQRRAESLSPNSKALSYGGANGTATDPTRYASRLQLRQLLDLGSQQVQANPAMFDFYISYRKPHMERDYWRTQVLHRVRNFGRLIAHLAVLCMCLARVNIHSHGGFPMRVSVCLELPPSRSSTSRDSQALLGSASFC
jgi:hypothetical protein